jgi:hypothetical protein
MERAIFMETRAPRNNDVGELPPCDCLGLSLLRLRLRLSAVAYAQRPDGALQVRWYGAHGKLGGMVPQVRRVQGASSCASCLLLGTSCLMPLPLACCTTLFGSPFRYQPPQCRHTCALEATQPAHASIFPAAAALQGRQLISGPSR